MVDLNVLPPDAVGPARHPGEPPFPGMVWIPGGTFRMGSDKHYPEEAPAHPVTVGGYWMDQYTVTNAQFSKFVEATDYVTSAEQAPDAPASCGVPAAALAQARTPRGPSGRSDDRLG